MDINDRELMERIERLAFQAGVACRGTEVGTPQKGSAIVKKLIAIGKAFPGNAGTCLFGPTTETNIEWSEIHELANE